MALLVRFFYSDFKLSAFFFFFYFYDWHFVKRNFTSYTFRKCLNYPTAFFFFFFFFFFSSFFAKTDQSSLSSEFIDCVCGKKGLCYFRISDKLPISRGPSSRIYLHRSLH